MNYLGLKERFSLSVMKYSGLIRTGVDNGFSRVSNLDVDSLTIEDNSITVNTSGYVKIVLTL